MPLSPGTYKIHDTDTHWALTYFASNMIGTDQDCDASFAKWYLKSYSGSSHYAIQVTEYKKYFAVDLNKDDPYGAEEGDSAVLEIEHQFRDFYLIKLAGTRCYLEHLNIKSKGGHTMVRFTDKVAFQGCFWQFEKINDDAGSILGPRCNKAIATPSTPQANNILSLGSGSQYTDDADFHTDILFNMPRTPFTRTQRMAALEWARKLGAANVPTMESFDECEKQLEESNSNATQNE
ncbi:hypothetical protein RSAG8_04925, partial [Rhizoctonia solani AG-8 WAC10335]